MIPEFRSRHGSCTEKYIRRGPFTIDLQNQLLIMKKKSISIPGCTFDYLVTLVRHSPNPVSYKQLVAMSQSLSLPSLEAQDLSRLRVYMLRKVIEPDPLKPQHILTIPGYGYRFVGDSLAE